MHIYVADAEAWRHGGRVACVDYSGGCAAWLQGACSAFSVTERLPCSGCSRPCTNTSLSLSEKCTLHDALACIPEKGEIHLHLWGGCVTDSAVFMHRHTTVAKTLQGTTPPAWGWFKKKKKKNCSIFNKINHTHIHTKQKTINQKSLKLQKWAAKFY